MLDGSMLPLLALYCLYRTLFPAENLSSLYLDSAVSPSGSQCNDLSLSVRTKESLYILHCRLKTQLIESHVTNSVSFLPYFPPLFERILRWKITPKLFIFELDMAINTVIESYTVARARRAAQLWCLLTLLPLIPHTLFLYFSFFPQKWWWIDLYSGIG